MEHIFHVHYKLLCLGNLVRLPKEWIEICHNSYQLHKPVFEESFRIFYCKYTYKYTYLLATKKKCLRTSEI